MIPFDKPPAGIDAKLYRYLWDMSVKLNMLQTEVEKLRAEKKKEEKR